MTWIFGVPEEVELGSNHTYKLVCYSREAIHLLQDLLHASCRCFGLFRLVSVYVSVAYNDIIDMSVHMALAGNVYRG